MSDFFKNKQKMLLAFGSFLLAVTILAGSFAYISNGMPARANQPAIAEPIADMEEADDHYEEWEYEENDNGEIVIPPRTPAQMRGVYLNPGVDFIATSDTTEATIRGEIDKALSDAVELGMNTVIINTALEDQVIYQTRNAPEISSSFDILEYAVEQARGKDLYTYVIFDASYYEDSRLATVMAIGAGTINRLSVNLEEFVDKYQVDGILVDGYEKSTSPESYGIYSLLGGGIGFENFMKQSPAAVVRTASTTIREHGRGVQVGLLADAVWANSEEHEAGSATKAAVTSLGSGNADTKAFVEQGLVDFVAVKAYSSLADSTVPFEEVVQWWADVARQSDVPLYVVHAADKVGQESGWTGDQLTKQVVALDTVSGVRGSIFNNLTQMVADPGQAATAIKQYYNEEVPAEYILAELEMTKPENTSYTTTEATVIFAGASDPNSPVTINGEAVATDSSGYFSVTMQLGAGSNTFAIAHKDKTINYNITRQVEILRDMSPTGNIATEGSMSIQISAWAYQDATVSATVNGATVPMKVDEVPIDEADRDSSYKLFTGQYTAPAATGSEQDLGSIVVTASWNGESKSLTGATVRVNKKAKIEDGVPVVVVADQAKTYPPSTLDNVPSPDYYPLPKGAMDYAVGEEIAYKKNDKTYTYTVLSSGLRVESKDIQAIGGGDYAAGNVISGMDVTARDGYTYVTLKTAQKVSYSFSYAASGVTIQFHNTVATPASTALGSNPIFNNASWNGSDSLTLSFIANNGFMGYKGYYDGSGNLVFRFNNPPASLAGARIAIDPGHGGSDPGTAGFLASHPEKVINRGIAEKLARELESRGATVLLLDTSGGMELADRVARAESFEADLFVSVHNNSGTRAEAKGTEVYYFYPYAKTLAANAAANVSSQLATENRGAKASYYHVTLSAQVPSILVECGFMSNQGEYEKLVNERYQSAIAVGIADSLSAAIKAANTGSSASGSQSVGNATGTTDDGAAAGDGGGGYTASDEVQDVYLNLDSATVAVGKSKTLQATVVPDSATNQNVTWSSGNTSVATVSGGGKVTGVKEGTAKITATTEDGGYTATCTVTVVAASSDADYGIEAEDIDLDTGDLSLDIGESRKLTATVYPKDADDTTVSWNSSDTAVATVDANGKVTGVKAGKATITATSNDGGFSIGCRVTVSSNQYVQDNLDIATTGVSLSKVKFYDFDRGSQELYIGTKTQLGIYSEYDDLVAPTDFTWKSSNTGVATVNEYGVVSAGNKNGTADITATPKSGSDGDVIACQITVRRTKVAATSISLNKSSLQIPKGHTYKDLQAVVAPSNVTASDLVWSSSKDKVVAVDQNGVLTAKAVGKVTISVYSASNRRVRAECEVEVLNAVKDIDYVEMEMVRLELALGETEALYAAVYPLNTVDPSLTWRSSDETVATVDQNGNVKAVGKGSATIRATSNVNKNLYDECEVTVYQR